MKVTQRGRRWCSFAVLRELRVDQLGDWQIEMGDDDINFDCHFFGFTQLYTPDKNEPVIAE